MENGEVCEYNFDGMCAYNQKCEHQETMLTIEQRVTEIERKIEIMASAMKKLQLWMDQVGDIQDIDDTLFSNLNDRVTKLEDELLVVDKQ